MQPNYNTAIYRRAGKESDGSSDLLEKIDISQAPEVLRQKAKGQFPTFERFIEIPETWEVQHMLAAAALACSHVVSGKERTIEETATLPGQAVLLVDDTSHYLKNYRTENGKEYLNPYYDGQPIIFGFSAGLTPYNLLGFLYSPSDEPKVKPEWYGFPSLATFHPSNKNNTSFFNRENFIRPNGELTDIGLEVVKSVGQLIQADQARLSEQTS